MAVMKFTGLAVFPMFLALAAASLAGAPEEVSPEAWASDDGACEGSSAEACGLSLRQLRIRSLQSSEATSEEQAGATTTPPSNEQIAQETLANSSESDSWPDGLAIPGGWGEGADFVDDIKQHEMANGTNGTEGLEGMSTWRGGSCQRYGCTNKFMGWLSCQCNPSCQKYGSCCWDYKSRCQHHSSPRRRSGQGNVITLYHQTGRSIGPLILRNGFRPGSSGWCGGGIYFATSAKATFTKAIGPNSHKGFMIEAKVNIGRVKHMSKHCNRGMTGSKLAAMGYDSITFNPGDGPEYIVYSKSRVLSTRQVAL